ncbi:hypothetical protein ILYODFUR_027744 [Ilyodon furcidens]|uniref:Uncharacterized protein n=1 Tax=Ilyodon furcidens TaxID=33524 RepID=A0ABV0T248_9TELE
MGATSISGTQLPCAHCHLIFLRVCKSQQSMQNKGNPSQVAAITIIISYSLRCGGSATQLNTHAASLTENEHVEEAKNITPHCRFVSRESPRHAALASTLSVLLYIKETKKTIDEL